MRRIPVDPMTPGAGQESVWDYPRPAVAERVQTSLEVVFAGRKIADAAWGIRTLETSHPPTYYLPPESVDHSVLRANTGRRSLCEWKGQAQYFDVVAGGRVAVAACWRYASPTASFLPLAGFFAFYPAAMDACRVDGEWVRPQPGDFYGGWITSRIVGPFKGEPGTSGW